MLCRYTNKGLLLIVFSLLITACGGENASTLPLPPPAGDSTSGSQVILGPIVGATVSAALASNTANTIETTTTTGSATNLNSAGRFSLQLTGVTDGVWVLVSVTGGNDIDADDNGVLDATPTANQGTIRALGKAADWRSGNANITVLSEILVNRLLNGGIDLNTLTDSQVESGLNATSVQLLQTNADVNGDNISNYQDILGFTPQNQNYPASVALADLNTIAVMLESGNAAQTDNLITALLNQPPVANAGSDQVVAEGSTVSLNATGTDTDGTIDRYAWVQNAGTTVTLTGAATAAATFVAPLLPANTATETLSFTLTVTDNLGASATDTVVVTLQDSNNNAPVITSANSASVSENTTAVLTLTASDADTTGETTTYALSGDNASLFTLNGSALAFQNMPDFEVRPCGVDNICNLIITPSDGTNTGPGQTFAVTLVDVNDSAPIITSGSTVSVLENTTVVLTLTASDADTTGETTTYALSGDNASLFTLNGSALAFQNMPDFEVRPCGVDNICNLIITPSDGINTGPGQTFAVTLVDVNDSAPVMTSASTVSVDENTTVVLTLTASDADSTGEAIDFTLGGSDASSFRLVGSALSFSSAPDFETPVCGDNVCTITLTPSDGLNTGSGQTVTVSVQDLNDTAPVMSSASTVSVDENTTVVLTLTASDADSTGETISFTLGGSDASSFRLVGSVLSFSSAPDFETPVCGDNVCTITLTPSDGLNTGSGQTVTVSVQDLNDTAPVMTSASTVSVDENITVVLTLTASDADTTGETTTYALSGDNASLFTLNGSALAFQNMPDFEVRPCGVDNICNLIITPSDGINTGLGQTFAVTLVDVNDSAPVMSSASTVSVDENTTVVLTLTASDADSTGEAIDFTLGGSDASSFRLVDSALSFSSAPDFETPVCGNNICTITITPSDGVNIGSAQTITVTVNDLAAITLANSNINEGNSGTTVVNVNVSLASIATASVSFSVSDGTATTADNDYSVANSTGTLNFTGGSTTAVVAITINGDTQVESDETLSIVLSNPINAELQGISTAILTINNDDSAAPTLNDTGVVFGADTNLNNSGCTSADTVIAQQDCSRGRDVTNNDASDGHAGFSFTKISSTGQPLAASASAWACTQDNITGLMWEVKTNDNGLHDRGDMYTWYSTDSSNNGGNAGTENTTTSCFGYNNADAATFCNTQAYVARINAAGLCGFTDWILPGREQLRSIANRNSFNPAIDTAYFPNTRSDNFYWSSSPLANNNANAWDFFFFDGSDSNFFSKSSNHFVRVVRASQ